MQIEGRVAVVTGGAGALGGKLVQRLLASGCRVVALDRDEAGLEALHATHPGTVCLTADLTHPDAVEKAVERIFTEVGEVSILINNAGVIRSCPLVNVLEKEGRGHSVDLWRQVLDVNLTSVFLMTTHVVDRMLQQRTKGVIVNISSISAAGNAGQSAYSAAKAGVEALTTVWAKELSGFGIRCAAVAPGFFATESTDAALADHHVERWREQIPLQRLGKAEELVDAVLFVVKNDYFNGRVLPVDGGLRL